MSIALPVPHARTLHKLSAHATPALLVAAFALRSAAFPCADNALTVLLQSSTAALGPSKTAMVAGLVRARSSRANGFAKRSDRA